MEFFFEIYDIPSRTDMGNDAAGAWVLKGWSNVWLASAFAREETLNSHPLLTSSRLCVPATNIMQTTTNSS